MNSAESSCEGKVAFKTFTLASTAAKRGGREKRRDAYHCQYCHQWHVGTHTKTIKPRKVVRK